MRTIKFRAWDKKRKVMVWDIAVTPNGYPKFWSDPMQFTGLLDKNKDPIYEGDVIKVQTTVNHHYNDDFFEPPEEIEQELIGEIVYRDNLAGFDIETIEPDLHLKNWCLMEDSIDVVEVIGNIHENPDLL